MSKPCGEWRYPLPEPFDVASSGRFLRMGPYDRTKRREQNRFWITARTAEGPATLCLESQGATAIVRGWGEGAPSLEDKLPGLLGLQDDWSGFEPDRPWLDELSRQHRGLRLVRAPVIVDVLIAMILQQRVTFEEAAKSYTGLTRRFSRRAPSPDGVELWLPPDPVQLAEAPYYALHPSGIERRRADTIRLVCQHRKKIEAWANAVSSPREHHALYRKLMSLRGLGPWTMGMTAGFGFGDPDAVVRGDYHLPNVVAWAFAREARGDDARMLELLEPYRGHRFRVVRLLFAAGVHAPRYGARRGPSLWQM